MSCRFPGAPDIDRFWELLRDGVDAITEIPEARWNAGDVYDPDPNAAGKSTSKWGGFIEDIAGFDRRFFWITKREAAWMDPQQRLALELTWEALEHAGHDPETLAGTSAAVFVAAGIPGWETIAARVPIHELDVYSNTGRSLAVLANRISYFFDFRGPSVVLDTACSGSLVAVHLACQSLWTGETSLAIAGGLRLSVVPEAWVTLSKAGMLSPRGKCRPFDAEADGYARSEGGGVVVLKPLSAALAAGDRVHAIIRGSAVNQDGRTLGLTVPNREAQEDLLRRAIGRAGVAPRDVAYVEAHGTGTPVGDPIEAHALGAVVGAQSGRDEPCMMGSLKGNIGHLEAAAGIAGLLKVVLSLRNGIIPPSLHFRVPNPTIPFDELGLSMVTELTAWPQGRRGLAGVSSFGFGGANAHVVLERAPDSSREPVPEASGAERPSHVLVLSGRTDKALEDQVGRYAGYLREHPELGLANVCHTAAVGRMHFERRLGVVAATREQLIADLDALARGEASESAVRGTVPSKRPKMTFLFTGQGAQYAGMGRALFETQPVFREALERCAAVLDPSFERPLLSVFYPAEGEASPIDETAYTQPALFALEHALVELWRSWGITPAAVIGHSVGEYAAACAAGVFSVEDGLRLIAARARLMGKLPRGGAMVSVRAGEDRVRAALVGYERTVSVAALNAPDQTVISGAEDDIRAIAASLEKEEIETKRLTVSHAFHSPLMAPMVEEFREVAESIDYSAPKIVLVGNVDGKEVTGEVASADYWVRHVMAPVRFAAGIAALGRAGVSAYVEIGPRPVLVALGQECLPEANAAWLPSLRKDRDDWETIERSLLELYVRGARVDWNGFDAPYRPRRVSLPTYPFQRERCWIDRPTSRRSDGPVLHPLLGVRVPLGGDVTVFEAALSTGDLPYLRDHRVFGEIMVSAAALLEMARAAGEEVLGEGEHALEDVVLQGAIVLSEKGARTVQVHVSLDDEDTAKFTIYSRGEGAEEAFTLHATGAIARDGAEDERGATDLASLRERCSEREDTAAFYEAAEEVGVSYGPSFRGVAELHRGDREAFARIELPESAGESGAYGIHPALLDAALQVVQSSRSRRAEAAAFLPFEIRRFACRGASGELFVHARLEAPSGMSAELDGELTLLDASGTTLGRVRLRARPATRAALRPGAAGPLEKLLFALEWRPAPVREVASGAAEGPWLLWGAGELRDALQERLGRTGVPLAADDPESLARALREAADVAGVVCVFGDGNRESASPAEEATRRSVQALELVKTLVGGASGRTPRLVLVTRGALAAPSTRTLTDPREVVSRAPHTTVKLGSSALTGLARVVRQEHPELGATLIDLDPESPDVAEDVERLVAELSATGEPEIAWRGGERFVPRLVREAKAGRDELVVPDAPSYALSIRSRGTFENLALEPADRRAPGPGEVELEVESSGLNFRDVLNALGEYPGEAGPLGLECAGRISEVGAGVAGLKAGDAVLAMARSSFGRFVTVDARRVARRPSSLGADDAAAIPIAFSTAWYGLVELGKLQKGDRVLIHAAAGGVGMAAVQLASNAGAEVFATASPGKWPALRRMGVEHLASSRTLDFAESFRRATAGRGVDLVLNSLTGEFIDASLGLLAPGGRFLEMGKRDLRDPAAVSARYKDVTYRAFDLAELAPPRIEELLEEIVSRFEKGTLRPLPVRTFQVTRAAEAFRFMSQAKHVGKLVLSAARPAPPAPRIRGDVSYLVTGGLGALGLQVAQRLVDRGARHLVLMGRRGPGEQAVAAIRELERTAASVRVAAGDVSRRSDLEAVLRAIPEEAPLGGVIHSVLVLDDGVLTEQTAERFARVMAPKVEGAWHLHELTKDQPLDFFVLFSSSAALFGSAGQSNYAAANAFLDALAEERRARGLPALSIAWGAWSGGGAFARLDEVHRRKLNRTALSPEDGLALFERALVRDRPYVAVLRFDAAALRGEDGIPPLVRELVDARPKKRAEGDGEATLLRKRLLEPGREDRPALFEQFLRAHVGRVLRLEPSRIDGNASLIELGMDSLMGVELRNRIRAELGLDVRTVEFLDSTVSLVQLSERLRERMMLAAGGPPRAEEPNSARETTIRSDVAPPTVDALSPDQVASALDAALGALTDS